MFYHDNEKLKVFANTRCGNTNMYHYFNIDVNKQKHFPSVYSNDLVIVLRNPLDRVVSATKGIAPEVVGMFPVSVLKKFLSTGHTAEFLTEWGVFYLHCKPYLSNIKDKPFRIIDFTQLSEYIPKQLDRQQSPVTNSRGYTDPKTVYVENKYFTLNDLETEYETYLELLKDREQISVAEWKEKTT